ncbi:MAG: Ig-like domain-containing protein [Lachnospiraceae bacterium]|nr:Ig-like domain-containing protein [Lachnospiraceae bacterium]
MLKKKRMRRHVFGLLMITCMLVVLSLGQALAGEGTITKTDDQSVDKSTTKVVAILKSEGLDPEINVNVYESGPHKVAYANPVNNYMMSLVQEAQQALAVFAKLYEESDQYKNLYYFGQVRTDDTTGSYDNRTYSWVNDDGNDDYILIGDSDYQGSVGGQGNRHMLITGDYAKKTVITITGIMKVKKDEESKPEQTVKPSTPSTPAPTPELTEQQITSTANDEDMKTSSFQKFCLKQKKASKNSITISWKKVSGAAFYTVYGARCGSKYQKIAETSATSFTQKKLKKASFYKYFVVANKRVNGKPVITASSKTVHITTSGGKNGNAKAVSISKTKKIKNTKKLTLKKGQAVSIKATETKGTLKLRRHVGIRYESSNTAVVTVDKKGKLQAKNKGSATIYVYAQNGVYKTMKVTIK